MKYTLTEKTILFRGRELVQIVRNDGVVGGHIESKQNLSQEGGCWVFCGGKVFDNALVFGNAEVFGVVCGSAEVGRNSVIGVFANVKSGHHYDVQII